MDSMSTPWTETAFETILGLDVPDLPDLDLEPRHDPVAHTGCADLLRRAGLRPTRQRLLLGWLLFSKGGRHVTAETLHDEAVAANVQVSLATVYNTLHQFTDAGMLRQIGVDGSKSFFDTNPTQHHHFFVDHEDRLLDVPAPGLALEKLPEPLPGYEVSRVEVIVRLRRKRG